MEILLELNFKQRKATRLLTTLCAFIAFIFLRNNPKSCLALVLAWALALNYPKQIYAFANTIGRDLLVLRRGSKLLIHLALIEFKQWSIAHLFERVAKRKPGEKCFVLDDGEMTFQQAKELSDKIGGYFKGIGLRHGDCVALLMETRLEYPCIWLGLSKIGLITALINSNLRGNTLLHSIRVAKPKALIVSNELKPALKEILNQAQAEDEEDLKGLAIYLYSTDNERKEMENGVMKGVVDLGAELKKQPHADLKFEIASCKPNDKILYVYTSGTTGLPKAAVITNLRFFFMSSALYYVAGIRENDVIYSPLPLYHTAGGIAAVGTTLIHGCCVVLRKKFSASNFWKDCIRHNCTVAQYIGELCRYLLSTRPQPEDTKHQVRLMYGNGLRPQIWTQFVSRFNIPHIAEAYGSTEGNSNMINISDRVGAVGFRPIYAGRFFPIQLVKCDETGEIIRNKDGFCIRCGAGESGLMIGRISPKHASTAFHGYADERASEKKLLRDVFRKGDVYFNSGDMMVADILGFFYFKDRTGDTFRWRGENVSTSEVEAIITAVIGLKDCAVYGVEIPHVEGKAGMAAIVDPERKVDLKHLAVGIRGNLPAYAQPLFIRLISEIARTETFKIKKRELCREGFDMRRVRDPIYYLNPDGVYRLLDEAQFEQLLNGTARL